MLDAELLLLGEGEEAPKPILAKQKLLYVERQLLTMANTKDIASTLNSSFPPSYFDYAKFTNCWINVARF